jgi:hypothetical protein
VIEICLYRRHASIRETNPAEDRLHLQRLLNLTSKPIKRLLAKFLPEMKVLRRGKSVKCSCSAKKLMAESIMIEDPM